VLPDSGGAGRAARRLIRAQEENAGGSAVATEASAAVENGSEGATASSPENSLLGVRPEAPADRAVKRTGASEPSGGGPQKRRKRHDDAKRQQEELNRARQREEVGRTARAERARRRGARGHESKAAEAEAPNTDADQRIHDSEAPRGHQDGVDTGDDVQAAEVTRRGRRQESRKCCGDGGDHGGRHSSLTCETNQYTGLLWSEDDGECATEPGATSCSTKSS